MTKASDSHAEEGIVRQCSRSLGTAAIGSIHTEAIANIRAMTLTAGCAGGAVGPPRSRRAGTSTPTRGEKAAAMPAAGDGGATKTFRTIAAPITRRYANVKGSNDDIPSLETM